MALLCPLKWFTRGLEEIAEHGRWSLSNIRSPEQQLRCRTLFGAQLKNLDAIQTSPYAQIHSGMLPSAVEAGRFHGLTEEKKLCLLCYLGDSEEKRPFHVLLLTVWCFSFVCLFVFWQ